MGYALYRTPLGDAGYAVEDVCHQDGCDEKIDRGLSYLCGDQPGSPSGGGCGRWFCGKHLYYPPEGVQIMGEGFCPTCFDKLEGEDVEE